MRLSRVDSKYAAYHVNAAFVAAACRFPLALFGRRQQALTRASVACLALLSMSCMVSAEQWNYNFALRKGVDLPVCRAYVGMLRQATFNKPIQCGRPTETRVPGFTTLQRVPLAGEVAAVLYSRIHDFTFESNQDYSDLLRVWKVHIGAGADSKEPDATSMAFAFRAGSLAAWRYVPPIDADNDGRPDNIIVWQGDGVSGSRGGQCGSRFGDQDWLNITAQFPFVVDDRMERINVFDTLRIFGHPTSYADAVRKPNMAQSGVRFAAQYMDLFKFCDAIFIDGFLDQYGDFNNHEVPVASLVKTLAVFKHEQKQPGARPRLQELCEIDVKDIAEVNRP